MSKESRFGADTPRELREEKGWPSTSDLDAIRERHYVIVSLDGRDICQHCQQPWPCDTRVVLDENASLRSALDIEHEAITLLVAEALRFHDDAERLAAALRLQHNGCGPQCGSVNGVCTAVEALRLHDDG